MVITTHTVAPTRVVRAPERRLILRNHLAERLGDNAEVVHLGEDTAVVVLKARPRHGIQLLLSVLTGGLWLPIWFILAVAMKDARHIVHVTEDGRVTWDAPGVSEPEAVGVIRTEPHVLCTSHPTSMRRPAPRTRRAACRPAARRIARPPNRTGVLRSARQLVPG